MQVALVLNAVVQVGLVHNALVPGDLGHNKGQHQEHLLPPPEETTPLGLSLHHESFTVSDLDLGEGWERGARRGTHIAHPHTIHTLIASIGGTAL